MKKLALLTYNSSIMEYPPPPHGGTGIMKIGEHCEKRKRKEKDKTTLKKDQNNCKLGRNRATGLTIRKYNTNVLMQEVKYHF